MKHIYWSIIGFFGYSIFFINLAWFMTIVPEAKNQLLLAYGLFLGILMSVFINNQVGDSKRS